MDVVDLSVFDSLSSDGGDGGATVSTVSSGSGISIAAIKARIHMFLLERSKGERPRPCDKWPELAHDLCCRFCKRYFYMTNNPLKSRGSPYLEVARPSARVCLSCRNTQNLWFKGWQAKQLEEEINRNKDFFQRYFLCVLLWEDRYNDPQGAIVKVVEDLPGQLRVSVLTTTSTSLQTSLQLGVFWPLNVFKKHEGHLPPKAAIQVINHNGVDLKGVMRESHFGTPIGTIKVKQNCSVTQSKELEHENSDRAARGAQQCDETFAALNKRMGVHINLPESDKPDAFAGVKMKHTDENAEDPLDILWQAPIGRMAGGTKKSTTSGAEPKPKKNQSKAGGSTKRQQELDLSEQAVLKARQLLNLLQAHDSLSSVTPQKLKSTLTQLNSRVRDSVMEHYAEEYVQNTSERTGMQILQDIRDLQWKLSACSELVTRQTGNPKQLLNIGTAVTASILRDASFEI